MQRIRIENISPKVIEMREAETNLIASIERINSGVLTSERERNNCYEEAVNRMLSVGFSLDYVNKMVKYVISG